MQSCLDCGQVNLMRFSALFQHRPPQSPAVEVPVRAEAVAPRPEAAVPASDLPEDLDARVRLLGEWQLFEG